MKFYLISLFVVSFYGWVRTSADKLSVCKTLDIKHGQSGSLKKECLGQTVFLGGGKAGPKGDLGPQGPAGPKGDKGEPASTSKNNCLGIDYMFPRASQNQDYVRYRAYVPSMKEVTVCAWVVNKNTKNFGSIISYATSRHDNELLFGFLSSKVARVVTGPVKKDLTLPKEFARTQSGKFHLCFQVSSIKQSATLFINGAQSSSVKSKFKSIVGGGTLILGQDQDKVNAGRLAASDSLNGNVQGLMTWPRLLTKQEINNIATKCDCPQDYSVVMTMDRSELHGKTSYKLPNQCPTLQN